MGAKLINKILFGMLVVLVNSFLVSGGLVNSSMNIQEDAPIVPEEEIQIIPGEDPKQTAGASVGADEIDPLRKFQGTELWGVLGLDIYNRNYGNVGIGTNDPQAKLDVAGDVRVQGLIKLDTDNDKPNCDESTRGSLWFEKTDQEDKLEICKIFVSTPEITVKSSVLPNPSAAHSCVSHSLSNKIYCFGGYQGSTYYNQIVEYDPLNDSIRDKGTVLPTGLRSLSCVESSSSHLIYCFGGYNGASQKADVLVYDSTLNTITLKAGILPYAVASLSCVEDSSTNMIYCFGGGTNSPISSIFRYNPFTDETTVMASTLYSALWALSCAEDASTHKIYCFGGEDGNYPVDKIVEYDPQTDYLITKSITLPTKRHGVSCTENSDLNKIICFGGSQGSTYYDQIIEYDPLDDIIDISSVTLPTGRTSHSCTEIDNMNNIYCLGGILSSGSTTNQIVEYSQYGDSSLLWTRIV